MANNYTKILELANKNNMGLSNTIKRDYGIPLDYSSVQESYEAALNYAKTNTLAYIGQPISVGDTLYIVTDETNGYLKAVGTQPAGDEQSVTIEADGKIAIKGFSSASNATFPRKTPEGTLEWVALDAIVNGDGNTKTVIQATDGSAITVIPTYDNKTDTYTYTLDVVFPAIPDYSVIKELGNKQTTYKFTKDGSAVGEFIIVPDAYDDTSIVDRISIAEYNINTHENRLGTVEDKVDAFFAVVENPDDVVNTLDEIQKYIADDKSGAASMAASIKENTDAINILNGSGIGSVIKTVEDAIAAQAIKDAKIYASQASLTETTSVANAAAAKASNLENALETKVDVSALNDALTDYYTKNETYSKIAIDGLLAGIKGEYGETADSVAAALEVHKDESDSKFSVLTDKNAVQDSSITQLFTAIESINSSTEGILAQAKLDAANKIDALKAGEIKLNTEAISALDNKISTANETIAVFANRMATLEDKDTQLAKSIAANAEVLEESRENLQDLSEAIVGYETAITTLQGKDAELSAAIAANTNNFNNYPTFAEVADKIDEKINTIDFSSLTGDIAINADAIETESNRAIAEEQRLGTLIQNNADAVAGNAAEIQRVNRTLAAALDNDGAGLDSIKELAAWIGEHDLTLLPVVEANTANIATLMGTGKGSVQEIVQNAISIIPFATDVTAGLVKASTEVTVNSDGTMGIGEVSTDKLVQGTDILVLNGGTAKEYVILT